MNKTGFGFLRLPLLNPDDKKSVNYPYLEQLVDRFLALGGTYFDTAYTYECSEESLRRTLVERHPRQNYRIANKLPGWKVKAYRDCQVFFNEQLERCGVTYFDVYLLHSLNKRYYEIAQNTDQFRFLRELKEQGLARAIGFSYHDSPELLDKILTEHPETEYVQLQINYLDWENPAIQAQRCYEVAMHHGKKVIVMEPVKGGNLVNLPEEAASMLQSYHPQWSAPSWAIRFAASLAGVDVVLSGMNTLEQIQDNLQDMNDLGQRDFFLLLQAAQSIRSSTAVGCTGCGYCLEECPQSIPIPRMFTLYNEYARYPSEDWKLKPAYSALLRDNAPASACADCGCCEARCPQKLPIREFLKKVSGVFE